MWQAICVIAYWHTSTRLLTAEARCARGVHKVPEAWPVRQLVHGVPTCEVLDASVAAGSLLKAHSVAHFLTQLTPTLLSNSASHAHSCYSSRLGDTNPAAVCKACLLQDLQARLSRSTG